MPQRRAPRNLGRAPRPAQRPLPPRIPLPVHPLAAGATCALLLCALLLAPSPAIAAEAASPALTVEKGSVVRDRVVALGRDLVVAGQVRADVAVVSGEARISGRVDGDVIVLGGSARLAESAYVSGDLYVLGGTVEAAQGAIIGGRSVAYPDATGAWLALLEAPAFGLEQSGALLLGAKLALLTAWLALVLVFFAASGRQVLATSESVVREPGRCFTIGLTGVVAMLLTAILFSLFAAALVGIPLVVLVVVLALVIKMWGMVAVFHALGGALVRRLWRRPATALNTATVGLLALGAVKLIPWVGLWAWHVATFIGIGAALITKFGRREPWFDLAALEGVEGRPAR